MNSTNENTFTFSSPSYNNVYSCAGSYDTDAKRGELVFTEGDKETTIALDAEKVEALFEHFGTYSDFQFEHFSSYTFNNCSRAGLAELQELLESN